MTFFAYNPFTSRFICFHRKIISSWWVKSDWNSEYLTLFQVIPFLPSNFELESKAICQWNEYFCLLCKKKQIFQVKLDLWCHFKCKFLIFSAYWQIVLVTDSDWRLLLFQLQSFVQAAAVIVTNPFFLLFLWTSVWCFAMQHKKVTGIKNIWPYPESFLTCENICPWSQDFWGTPGYF